MSSIDWGGFADNALNTTLGVWAAREQAKLGYGTALAPSQQGAVSGTPEVDTGTMKEPPAGSTSGAVVPWYKRKSVLITGGVVAGAAVLYLASRRGGK